MNLIPRRFLQVLDWWTEIPLFLIGTDSQRRLFDIHWVHNPSEVPLHAKVDEEKSSLQSTVQYSSALGICRGSNSGKQEKKKRNSAIKMPWSATFAEISSLLLVRHYHTTFELESFQANHAKSTGKVPATHASVQV